jgi:hypothetical protein
LLGWLHRHPSSENKVAISPQRAQRAQRKNTELSDEAKNALKFFGT